MRPSNILVQGRSGSGKTEMFRVIAKLFTAPMIRVEATRYTEVGYHGDDVTNIIVDLYKKCKLIILLSLVHSELLNPETASKLFMQSPHVSESYLDQFLVSTSPRCTLDENHVRVQPNPGEGKRVPYGSLGQLCRASMG